MKTAFAFAVASLVLALATSFLVGVYAGIQVTPPTQTVNRLVIAPCAEPTPDNYF